MHRNRAEPEEPVVMEPRKLPQAIIAVRGSTEFVPERRRSKGLHILHDILAHSAQHQPGSPDVNQHAENFQQLCEQSPQVPPAKVRENHMGRIVSRPTCAHTGAHGNRIGNVPANEPVRPANLGKIPSVGPAWPGTLGNRPGASSRSGQVPEPASADPV